MNTDRSTTPEGNAIYRVPESNMPALETRIRSSIMENGETRDNCYAETWAKRTGFQIWGDDSPRRYFGDKHWNEPLKWNRDAEAAGVRRRVFCMSMGDWAEGRPEQAEPLARWWDLCGNTPHLDKLMLTKRPQLIRKLCPITGPDIWHGVTAETQAWLDLRWKFLREVDAAVHWLSMEPLFERITLPQDFLDRAGRAWVIVGGESGGHARPMDPKWAQHLRDQCKEASVPYHFKQGSANNWGKNFKVFESFPVDLQIREVPCL